MLRCRETVFRRHALEVEDMAPGRLKDNAVLDRQKEMLRPEADCKKFEGLGWAGIVERDPGRKFTEEGINREFDYIQQSLAEISQWLSSLCPIASGGRGAEALLQRISYELDESFLC